MNQSNTQQTFPAPGMGKEPGSAKMLMTMGGVGLVAAVLLVFTYQFTLPYIKINQTRMLEKAITEVVPGTSYKKVFTVNEAGQIVPLEKEDEKAFKIYACYSATDSLLGVAIEARGQGFQDVIHLIYGYSPAKQAIVGMKVLESTETPGLGDKITRDPDFLSNFKELSVQVDETGTKVRHLPELVKAGQKTKDWQIVAITGATISSRAVTNILRKSTEKNIPLIMQQLKTLKGGHNG